MWGLSRLTTGSHLQLEAFDVGKTPWKTTQIQQWSPTWIAQIRMQHARHSHMTEARAFP